MWSSRGGRSKQAHWDSPHLKLVCVSAWVAAALLGPQQERQLCTSAHVLHSFQTVTANCCQLPTQTPKTPGQRMQDYAAILARAQEEADIVLWDGGNNDTPFFKPGVSVCQACLPAPLFA